MSFFGPLNRFYNQQCDNWAVSHPGSAITDRQIGQLFGEAYKKTATTGTAINGFAACGIEPFNDDVFDESSFAPAITTERGNASANDTSSDTAAGNNQDANAQDNHDDDDDDDDEGDDDDDDDDVVDVIAPNAVNGDDVLATLNEATSLVVTVDVHTMPVRHIGTAGCNAHQRSCTTTVGCQRSYFGCQNSAIAMGHVPRDCNRKGQAPARPLPSSPARR